MVVPQTLERGFYRHFKGGLYEVLDTVIDSETLRTMVLYRPVASSYLWVRDFEMFTSLVDRDGKVQNRFVFIGSALEG